MLLLRSRATVAMFVTLLAAGCGGKQLDPALQRVGTIAATAEQPTSADVPDLTACFSLPGGDGMDGACAIDSAGNPHALAPGVATLPDDIVWFAFKFAAAEPFIASFPPTFIESGDDATLRVYAAPGRLDDMPSGPSGDIVWPMLPEKDERNRVASRGLRTGNIVVVRIDAQFTPGHQLSVARWEGATLGANTFERAYLRE